VNQQAVSRIQFQLPSHLATVSAISHERMVLAIDSASKLFVSRDAGRHWKPIPARWAGHAVKVGFASTTEDKNVAVPTGALMRAAKIPAASDNSIQNAPPPISSNGNAALTGVVTDRSGAVVSNATVTITDVATARSIVVKTDAAGRYLAGKLEPGVYAIQARSMGFRTQILNEIKVPASATVVQNIALELGAASQTVTVEASSLSIQTDRPDVGAMIEDQGVINAHPAAFELTTDAGEVWTSSDGRHWKRK